MKERLSMTPGTPRFTTRRLENEEDKVNAKDDETYRSGVGALFYLTKHSRPDISNPVRELSKTMDAPAPAHLKEMYKLIRFVLSTKDYGLKFKLIRSIRKWVLKALSDSDFASDNKTRISVFGYVIYFCGIPIAWRSKGMKSVVLSTTEAEYMALSEVVKELKFVVQLLQTMNITVELPITVHVDNVGAIWLSNNRTTVDRTKHIDIRTSFVKELTEVCYLLEVSWQMCHAWITHWTVARAILTMSRRRSTHDERTHGRDARKPLLARTRARLAPLALVFES